MSITIKMLRLGIALIVLLGAVSVIAVSQQIQKLDPWIDQIVPPTAALEKVATGFNKWTEGPVWTPEGTLLFAEIPSNSIMQWTPGQAETVFMHPSGYKGSVPFKGDEPGSNGMTLDSSGRVTVAGHAGRTVWRLESLNPKAQVTVLADSYKGKKLNSPNDLVYKSDGSLYFTDPPYGLPTQSDKDPMKELDVNGVYRIPAARQQKPGVLPDRGNLQLVIKDLPRPNGLAFSPDEKVLYVADSQRKVWMSYQVQPDGSVTNGVVLLDCSSDSANGVPDGLRIDRQGNIYAAGPAGVWIISPQGRHLGTIKVPEVVSNVAWGDQDKKSLYITASTSIYRIKLNIPGDRNH